MAYEASKQLATALKKLGAGMDKLRIIGPGDASISKINDVYRRVIYIKAYGMDNIIKMRQAIDNYNQDGVNISVDVNPMSTY